MPRNRKSPRSGSVAVAKSNSPRTPMKSALRTIVAKLKTKLRSLWKEESLRRYAIAKVVQKVRVGQRRYGAKAVEQIAKAVGIDAKTLYRWATIADTWPSAPSFEKLLSRKNVRGLPMTWSHFEALSEVTAQARREKLIEKVLTEGLSVRQLRAVMDGQATEAIGGSVPVKSSGALAAIVHGEKSLETALEAIDHLSNTKVNGAVAGQLDSLRALCERAAKQIQELLAAKSTAINVSPGPADVSIAAAKA